MTINFGAINGRRAVTFRVDNDRVMPARFKDTVEDRAFVLYWNLGIKPSEKFRRWKIARKAWRTRKWKNQLELGL